MARYSIFPKAKLLAFANNLSKVTVGWCLILRAVPVRERLEYKPPIKLPIDVWASTTVPNIVPIPWYTQTIWELSSASKAPRGA